MGRQLEYQEDILVIRKKDEKVLFAVVYLCFITVFMVGMPAAVSANEGNPPDSHPCRIACLSPYPAEILCDIGEADRIAAISKLQKNDPYYELLKNKPIVGGGFGHNINLEMVLGVDPDLVFCSNGQKDVLRARGLNVYTTRTYDIQGIMGLITDIGKTVGKEEIAKRIIDEMKTRIQKVEEKVKRVKDKPLVYYEQSALGKTRAKGSLTHDLITRAGGINIAKDEPVPFPILSQEFIIQKNPDVIIVEEWGTKPSTVKKRDGWKNMKAVALGRIFRSRSYYTGYTTRCLDGLEEYAKFFYPELFNK